MCGGRGADYQQCLVLLILGATTAAGKTDWALKQHICLLMATMLIHITMEIMCICYSISRYCHDVSTSRKFLPTAG